MTASAPTVINPSPMPIRAWMPPMAGIAMLAGEVPDSASSSAAARDAMKTESHPATNPLTGTPQPRLTDQPLHGAIREGGHEYPDDGHIEDVRTQGQQPAVLEDQRLDADHGGQDQDGRPRPEQDGGQSRAQQVARGTAGNGEVQHLAGEDAGRQDAHERHLALVQVSADALQGERDHDDRDQKHDDGDGHR